MMINEMTVTAKLKRIDICDLKLACGVLSQLTEDEEATKWTKLHDKLKAILDEFDEKIYAKQHHYEIIK